MVLNYFCQPYYDPEIGRFITLDSWTQLPDDERLLSYSRYLSWNNHTLKSIPEPVQQDSYSQNSASSKYYYNNLANAIIPYSDLQTNQLNRNLLMNSNRLIDSRYTLMLHNHQVNGYLYCMNNPLLYIDPSGLGIERQIVGVLGGFAGGVIVGAIGAWAGGGALSILTGALGAIGGGIGGYLAATTLFDYYNPPKGP